MTKEERYQLRGIAALAELLEINVKGLLAVATGISKHLEQIDPTLSDPDPETLIRESVEGPIQ